MDLGMRPHIKEGQSPMQGEKQINRQKSYKNQEKVMFLCNIEKINFS